MAEANVKCLAGLDEAGLGPILGPLVIAGAAMRGPAGIDPWDALNGTVVRKRPKAGQVHVADSKKVKSGPHGFERLERTVLTFWSAWRGDLPSDFPELLEGIGFDFDAVADCPWYEDLEVELPRQNDRRALELGGHLLRRRLDEAEIEILKLAMRPVEVAEFNRLIEETDNKGTTHFQTYAEVLGDLLRHAPDGSYVVADRCGGRTHYRRGLADAGVGTRIHVERETDDASVYRMTTEQGRVTVMFTSRGEERAFPTALASCCAKYLRELFIERLNAWFCSEVPELKPTAGYYVDGNRFLDDIKPFVERQGLPMDRLVRSR